MSLSIGIVGLPNVGKSTIFNALVKSQLAEAANYAFTTIEPNVGIVEVPDGRLEKLAEVESSDRIVPTTVKFIDIAGLIAGAHKGEGLGNKFLAHIREVDAIAMVVRLFINDDVVHVAGQVNPKEDIETIVTELILADNETLQKKLNSLEKEIRAGSKVAQKQLEIVKKIIDLFDKGQPAFKLNLSEEDKELIKEFNLMTIKPFLFVLNVNEDNVTFDSSDLIEEHSLQEFCTSENTVAISAKIESELATLPEVDQAEFLADFGLTEPGLYRLISASYKTLDLISFFTAGPMEARAWTVNRGDKAPQAAGKIHTDFEKKFIKAEVVNWEEFVKVGGWTKAKEAGKVKLEGKEYIIRDGDVVFIFHG